MYVRRNIGLKMAAWISQNQPIIGVLVLKCQHQRGLKGIKLILRAPQPKLSRPCATSNLPKSVQKEGRSSQPSRRKDKSVKISNKIRCKDRVNDLWNSSQHSRGCKKRHPPDMIKSQAFEAPKIQEILKIEEAPKSLEKSAEIVPKIMTPISKKSSEVSDLERDDESSPSEESLGSIHDLKSGIPRINLNSKESLWTKSQRDTEGSRPRTMGTGGISITEKMKTLPKNSALFRIFERNYADDKEQSLTWKNLELKSQNKETFNAYYKKLQKEQEKHKEWERTLPVQERLKRRNNKKLELLKVHSHKNSVADQMSWQKKRDGLHTTKNCSFVK